jgi:hypothetical protein
MAQSTGGMSFRAATLEMSTDTTTWTDYSGVFNKIKPKGGNRKSGSVHTATGDKPVLTVGKKEPVSLDVDVLYTEVSTELFTLVDGWKDNATPVYMRWTAKGTATGNYRYTTDAGYITDVPPPAGDVDKADPLVVTFTLDTPGYTRAAIS